MTLPYQETTVEGTIRSYLSSLIAPGAVHEVRAFGVEHPDGEFYKTMSGFFDNLDDLASAVAEIDGCARGIYYTLNSLRPEILARSPDRLRRAFKGGSATSRDVLRRRWLPIDIDPVREKNTNASQEELDAAFDLADKVMKHLLDRGWDRPIVGFSGNGWHQLYPLDMPPDDDRVRRVIHKLSVQFSNERAVIDTKVSDSVRLWKLYGTMTRKGDHSGERPHRRSFLFGPRGVAA